MHLIDRLTALQKLYYYQWFFFQVPSINSEQCCAQPFLTPYLSFDKILSKNLGGVF